MKHMFQNMGQHLSCDSYMNDRMVLQFIRISCAQPLCQFSLTLIFMRTKVSQAHD